MRINGVDFPDKTMLATPFELMRVASGHRVAFRTSDGEDVTLRLYTADELMEANAEAIASLPAGGPPFMSRSEAERLTKPLPV